MTNWTVSSADLPDVERLAELIALKVRPGDTLALNGDLGAGKTTFARALIRAVLADPDADVPSPTFSLVQTYEAPRLALAHLDLYRLSGADEVLELGIDELLSTGAVIVEWPERAGTLLGGNRLDIHLGEASDPGRRHVRMTASGTWAERLARLERLAGFVASQPGNTQKHIAYLQGDASTRAYARLLPNGGVIMDWPRQPDGPPIRDRLPYSRIAHIAEAVPAFVAVAGLLQSHGFTVPAVRAADLDHGFLLIDDLGDQVFGTLVASGADMRPLWRSATEVLVDVRALAADARQPLRAGSGETHAIPAYDRRALGIEVELLTDWYWPAALGGPTPERATAAILKIWNSLFDVVLAAPAGLTLRDYHSPNLMWRPDGPSLRERVGIIDFQDAVIGHPAYDLVSLLQDARLDVPAELEAELLALYCAMVAARNPAFDAEAFKAAYAILGAQRATKILGIFARLWKRDGKPQYLRHIPRLWRYLDRNLSHPDLADLKAWFDTHLPAGAPRRLAATATAA